MLHLAQKKTYKESGQAYGDAKSEHSFKLFTHFYELHVSGTLFKLLHMNAISIHSDNYVSVKWYDKLVSIQHMAWSQTALHLHISR